MITNILNSRPRDLWPDSFEIWFVSSSGTLSILLTGKGERERGKRERGEGRGRGKEEERKRGGERERGREEDF